MFKEVKRLFCIPVDGTFKLSLLNITMSIRCVCIIEGDSGKFSTAGFLKFNILYIIAILC